MHTGNFDEKKVEYLKRNLPMVERSDGKVEEFIQERIYDSLIKETSMPMELAKDVTEEMVKRLILMEQKVVTAPFIREQVCNILYGKNPSWRFEYTRIGMPYHDFETLCGDIFKNVDDWREIDEKAIEDLMTSMGREKVVQIICRMARNYVGVRNIISGVDYGCRKQDC